MVVIQEKLRQESTEKLNAILRKGQSIVGPFALYSKIEIEIELERRDNPDWDSVTTSLGAS